jgi:hypothetical protein
MAYSEFFLMCLYLLCYITSISLHSLYADVKSSWKVLKVSLDGRLYTVTWRSVGQWVSLLSYRNTTCSPQIARYRHT